MVYAEQQTSFMFFPIPFSDVNGVTLCPGSDPMARTLFGLGAVDEQPLVDSVGSTKMLSVETVELGIDAILTALRGGECVDVPTDLWSPWLPVE